MRGGYLRGVKGIEMGHLTFRVDDYCDRLEGGDCCFVPMAPREIDR